jgi:hypothetical protein
VAYKKTRCPDHDYHARAIYLITINKDVFIPTLSHIFDGEKYSNHTPGVKTTEVGNVIKTQLRRIPELFPQTQLLQYVIMPDHLHFVLFVKESTEYHLGDIIMQFKMNCRDAYGKSLFEDGYNDRILRTPSQLRNMIDYVKDNPKRWLIRREHPDFFCSGRVLQIGEQTFPVYGNFLLLRNPTRAAVRISRSYSEDKLRELHRHWEEIIRSNGVLISPFISEKEKAVRELAISEGGNIILLTREEITERYKPSVRLFDLCQQGRLLIMSIWKPGLKSMVSRSEALIMNDLAARIAADATLPLMLKGKR